MSESLAGKLLIASLRITEPTFYRTVVLVCAHDENGALGVVINRPLKNEPIAKHLPQFEPLAREPVCIFDGGPVEGTGALVLARWKPVLDIPPPNFVLGRSGLLDLSRPIEEHQPHLDEVRVFAGYTGWTGGQLEDEFKEESWFVVEGTEDDIFSSVPASLWKDVLRRQPGKLAMFAYAPKDPAVN